MNSNLLEKISGLFLREKVILEGAVEESTVLRSLPGWDSLKHLMILMDVEKEFGVEISPEDISRINTVGDLINIIKKDGNPRT